MAGWDYSEELGQAYVRMLHSGLIAVRDAIAEGQRDWAYALADLLHNLPSLIGEPNGERHRYFWKGERPLYLERIAAVGSEEAVRHTRIYFEPIWTEIGPLMPE